MTQGRCPAENAGTMRNHGGDIAQKQRPLETAGAIRKEQEEMPQSESRKREQEGILQPENVRENREMHPERKEMFRQERDRDIFRNGDTLWKMLRDGAHFLEQYDVPDASNDARLLLEYCIGLDRTRYFLEKETTPDVETRERYFALLKQRAQRIPLQQLTGRQWFCGLEFLVNDQVLIPRQDTECLVEAALEILQPGMRILDLCTGSGCIILSLAKLARQPELSFFGADLSGEALGIARKNADRLGANVTFSQGDLFEGTDGTFDCVISNPPYIARAELADLMPEVRDHEPRMALDGGEDGLQFYRRILEGCAKKLNPGGWLLFEIGYDQGEAVSALMRGSMGEKGRPCFHKIEVRKDLAGLDRIVMGRRR